MRHGSLKEENPEMLTSCSKRLMAACCSMLAVWLCAQPHPNAATLTTTSGAGGNNMSVEKASAQDEGGRHYGGKMILGAEEFVHVKEAGATFAARVDTGANYSSLSAVNIRHFERDGRKYVGFDVEANDRKFSLEAVLVRTDTIRQVASATAQTRPIVRLTVKVGPTWVKTVFSLADRGRMQYPLLLGRTFLKDHALVDASRAFVQGMPSDAGEVILQRDAYLKAKSRGNLPAPKGPEHESEDRIAYPAAREEAGSAQQDGRGGSEGHR